MHAWFQQSEKFWPLYEVVIRPNWNEDETIAASGDYENIPPTVVRLFYAKDSAHAFARALNRLVAELGHEIE